MHTRGRSKQQQQKKAEFLNISISSGCITLEGDSWM